MNNYNNWSGKSKVPEFHFFLVNENVGSVPASDGFMSPHNDKGLLNDRQRSELPHGPDFLHTVDHSLLVTPF